MFFFGFTKTSFTNKTFKGLIAKNLSLLPCRLVFLHSTRERSLVRGYGRNWELLRIFPWDFLRVGRVGRLKWWEMSVGCLVKKSQLSGQRNWKVLHGVAAGWRFMACGSLFLRGDVDFVCRGFCFNHVIFWNESRDHLAVYNLIVEDACFRE